MQFEAAGGPCHDPITSHAVSVIPVTVALLFGEVAREQPTFSRRPIRSLRLRSNIRYGLHSRVREHLREFHRWRNRCLRAILPHKRRFLHTRLAPTLADRGWGLFLASIPLA